MSAGRRHRLKLLLGRTTFKITLFKCFPLTVQSSQDLTDVVPAASSGGAADPVSLKHVDLPVAFGAVRQRVGGHVADLHPVVVPLEVLKLHPAATKQGIFQSRDHVRRDSRQSFSSDSPEFSIIR